jgi:hypothetical protein
MSDAQTEFRWPSSRRKNTSHTRVLVVEISARAGGKGGKRGTGRPGIGVDRPQRGFAEFGNPAGRLPCEIRRCLCACWANNRIMSLTS